MSALLMQLHEERKARQYRFESASIEQRHKLHLARLGRAWDKKRAEQAAKEASVIKDDHSAPEPVLCNRPASSIRKELLRQVMDTHGVELNELLADRRLQKFVRARHELYWKLKTYTTMSYPAIGRFLGGRDHTTILHGVKKHEERMRHG